MISCNRLYSAWPAWQAEIKNVIAQFPSPFCLSLFLFLVPGVCLTSPYPALPPLLILLSYFIQTNLCVFPFSPGALTPLKLAASRGIVTCNCCDASSSPVLRASYCAPGGVERKQLMAISAPLLSLYVHVQPVGQIINT